MVPRRTPGGIRECALGTPEGLGDRMRRIKTFKETGRLCSVNNFKGKYTDPKKFGQRYCQFLFNGHDFCPYGCPEAVETVNAERMA